MKRSPLKRTKPTTSTGLLRVQAADRHRAPARKATLKAKQRPVSAADKLLWSKLAALGCIACMKDGHYNPNVSIHHVDGRTKEGCHHLVLALCAGHHQDGTGQDKTLVAVHPWKSRFEAIYGSQEELMDECAKMLYEMA